MMRSIGRTLRFSQRQPNTRRLWLRIQKIEEARPALAETTGLLKGRREAGIAAGSLSVEQQKLSEDLQRTVANEEQWTESKELFNDRNDICNAMWPMDNVRLATQAKHSRELRNIDLQQEVGGLVSVQK